MSDWGQGAKNNDIGWGQGAVNNSISWGLSHSESWAGDTNIIGGTPYDTDYQAILDYATTQGYTLPSDSQKTLQNQLLIDLKTAGVWNKLDTFANFATDGSSNFALIDWKRLSQYTAVNSPTFTTNQGYNSNGTSSYINSNYNLSTNSTNVLINSLTFGYWTNTGSNGAASSFLGAVGVNGGTQIIPNLSTNTRVFLSANSINGFINGSGLAPFADTNLMSLTSDGTTGTFKRNITSLGTFLVVTPQIFNGNVFILSRNLNGSVNDFLPSVSKISMTFYSSLLDNTELGDLKTSYNTYITSL